MEDLLGPDYLSYIIKGLIVSLGGLLLYIYKRLRSDIQKLEGRIDSAVIDRDKKITTIYERIDNAVTDRDKKITTIHDRITKVVDAIKKYAKGVRKVLPGKSAKQLADYEPNGL